MEKNNIFTIITPCYNSFDKMEKYLQSLERQSFKDFEVIIIDDCSIDDSFRRLTEYSHMKKIDLKIYKTDKNLGPGNARNIGLNNASGNWITFIDCDDYVDTKLLECINNLINQFDMNCFVYNYWLETRDGKKSMSSFYGDHREGVMDLHDVLPNIRNHAVCKFYKREIIERNNIRFPNVRRFEDIDFTIRAIIACSKVYYYNKELYHYVQWEASLSKNMYLTEKDLIIVFEKVERALEKDYPEALLSQSVSTLLYGGVLNMCKSKKSNKEVKKFINNYETKYPSWEKASVIQYLGMGKRIFLKAIKLRQIYIVKIITHIHGKNYHINYARKNENII